MGWRRFVGLIKLQVFLAKELCKNRGSFAKETYIFKESTTTVPPHIHVHLDHKKTNQKDY